MKRIIKIIGILSLFVLAGIFLLTIAIRLEHKKYFPTDVVHCVIQLEEEIDSLKSIEFNICDRTYIYTIDKIKDTISENLEISGDSFPCLVNFIYHLHSKSVVIKADSFFNSGHSGTNIYMLKKDSIFYKYVH